MTGWLWLMDYNARYDNLLAWDRNGYTSNNPVLLIDSSGHYACSEILEDQCLIDHEQASYQIANAGLKPEKGCSPDLLCSDNYKTFTQVTMALGRVPKTNEILMMTAGTECLNTW